jgi:hypothetical protein
VFLRLPLNPDGDPWRNHAIIRPVGSLFHRANFNGPAVSPPSSIFPRIVDAVMSIAGIDSKGRIDRISSLNAGENSFWNVPCLMDLSRSRLETVVQRSARRPSAVDEHSANLHAI